MKISHLLPAAAFVVLSVACDKKSAGPAAAGGNPKDGYVLATKNYIPPVGTVTTKEMSMVMDGATVKIKAGDTEMSGTATQTADGKETIEVLSKDKIRRTIVSKTTGGKMTMNPRIVANVGRLTSRTAQSAINHNQTPHPRWSSGQSRRRTWRRRGSHW